MRAMYRSSTASGCLLRIYLALLSFQLLTDVTATPFKASAPSLAKCTCGFVLCATGDRKYLNEAASQVLRLRSVISSARKGQPHCCIALYTDKEALHQAEERVPDGYGYVRAYGSVEEVEDVEVASLADALHQVDEVFFFDDLFAASKYGSESRLTQKLNIPPHTYKVLLGPTNAQLTSVIVAFS